MAQICHKPWRAKSPRLAAAYTSYGAADKILRQLMAYEVYGGLRRRLGALTVGSGKPELEEEPSELMSRRWSPIVSPHCDRSEAYNAR